MNRKCFSFILALGLLLGFDGVVLAQTPRLLGTLSRSRPSVLSVMQRAGCNPSWLSQVVADSRINPDHLRNLSVGQRVQLRSRSCKVAPPAAVASQSRLMLSRDADVREARVLRDKLSELGKTFAETGAENNTLKVKIENMGKEIADLNQILRATKAEVKALTTLSDKKFGVVNTAYISIIFLSMGVMIGFFALTPRVGRNRVSALKRRSVKYKGKVYTYTLVDTVRDANGGDHYTSWYACAECKEVRIKGEEGNFFRHAHKHFLTEEPVVTYGPGLEPNRSGA